MAGLIEEHIQKARQLLAEAEAEYQKAQQEVGGAVITTLCKSGEKGRLAVLEAAEAFLLKQGIAQDELPETSLDIEWEVTSLLPFYENHDIKDYYWLLNMFQEEMLILMFEYVPKHFEELRKFIDKIETAPAQDRAAE
jgi:hypothetical protein